jgi:dihydrofolate reductase
MTDPGWRNSTVLSGDVVDEVRSLKEQPGKDVMITGSIKPCHAIIEAGLVDEFRLFVYPVVQGRGRRLFPDEFELPRLTLLGAKSFRCGIAYLHYAPS